MSGKLQQFKDEIANSHLVPIEALVQGIWPGEEPKITLLIRTPWLPDGGIIVTNDSLDAAMEEMERLSKKPKIA